MSRISRVICSWLPYLLRFPHLALAAFFAIAARLEGLRLAALALPPFKPPRRPNATAAGFLAGVSSAAWVTCSKIDAASWFTSLLERFGMRPNLHIAFKRSRAGPIKLTHYPAGMLGSVANRRAQGLQRGERAVAGKP